ncbi:MAG: hypothetical protein QNK37_31775 [Acidobacteriota bacterium]|nr:hypothetical protein [Acidobacteriota bacterium]
MKKRMKLADLKVTSFKTSESILGGGMHTDDCIPIYQQPGGDSNEMAVCQTVTNCTEYGACSGFCSGTPCL